MTYEEFLDIWDDGSALVECRTSGSTGTPKSIMLPKAEMARSARRTIGFFGLDRNSHLHSCIAADFIGGRMMAVRARLTGGSLTWEKPSNRPLREYCGEPIDLLAVVPSQMIYILDNLDEIPPLRNIIIGGAPIPAEVRRRITKSGLNAYETYGMTETASHIALRRVTDPPLPFMPLDGIRIDTDAESRLVIDMAPWQRIVTNDVARVNTDGSFEILGRADNAIITGGKKVHPEQLEDSINTFIYHEVMVTSVPCDKWGQKIVLIVDDSSCPMSDEEIIQLCRLNLPDYCVPKTIVHKPVPHTSNGKKKRN